jgi:hypothetical protein
MSAGSVLHPLLAALESTQLAHWPVPLDTVALHLRALLVKEGIQYEDLGKKTGFGVSMEAFALVGLDISLILFQGTSGNTAIAVGEGLRAPKGLGKKLVAFLEDKLKTRTMSQGPPPPPSPAGVGAISQQPK